MRLQSLGRTTLNSLDIPLNLYLIISCNFVPAMRAMHSLALAATLGVGALAQVTGLRMQVEAPDFDVAQALIGRGVDVAKLSLVDVSPESACAFAVST